MNRMICVIVTASALMLAAAGLHVRGQQKMIEPSVDAPQPVVLAGTLPPPQTRLEALSMRESSVIVRSHGEAVVLNGDDGSLLRLSPIEVKDVRAALRATGLLITLRSAGRNDEETSGYIDRDEIDRVLAAIETLGGITADPKIAARVDGSFRTRGDIEFANVEANGSRMLVTRTTQIVAPTGQISTATAIFRLSRLGELDRMLRGARDALGQFSGSEADQPE